MSNQIQNNGYKDAVQTAIEKHGASYDSLIPILLEINQVYGYIPVEALSEIKTQVNSPDDGILVQEGRLFSLASFYHMLSTKPLGRHVVLFCESAPCHVSGGRAVWQALQEELHLHAGETSPDGKWSLLTTSCLGVCGVGPVVVVDEDMFGNVTPEQLPHILSGYE
jgi:NADH:ubiquinone oxidoreductase subunit E